MRIISLVPNATEIVFALGAGDRLVGVSHECDFPPEAGRLPILTGSALSSDLAGAEIDAAVDGQLDAGHSLYTIDERLVEELGPELILTQHLCPVCAVSQDQVASAVEPMRECPEVLSLDPKTLGDVFSDIHAVGRRLQLEAEAAALVRSLEARIEAVAQEVRRRGGETPAVCALEWLDPPYLAGHWVPEMISIAGGRDAFAEPGAPSRRTSWNEIAAIDPAVVVAMPCGFDQQGSSELLETLAGLPQWRSLGAVRAGRVYAVDANGCFSRPGPRLVDGIEALAPIFGEAER